MRFYRLAAALLAGLALPALFARAETPRASHVFIVSFDQGSPESIEKADMPNFKRMAEEGAHTWDAFTIVPSLTLPSHVSMLTGVGIQKHQVDWNELDPEKGFPKVPTIFALAKKQGLTTAMYVGKIKFKVLELPRTVDRFVLVDKDPSAVEVAKAFAADLKTGKPNLGFIHFADSDLDGHSYGVLSPEKLLALAHCDQALGILMKAIDDAGLTDSSVVILTADHGGHDRTPQENADRAKRGNGYQPGTHGSSSTADVVIPWVAWGDGVKKHFRITAPVIQYDTAATALWLLGVPLPEYFWGRPVASAFQ